MVSDFHPRPGAAPRMSGSALQSPEQPGVSGVASKALGGRVSDDIWLYVATLSGGGAERVFVRLANYYAEQGLRVRLVVNHAAGPLAALVSPRVQVHSLGCRRAWQAMPRLTIALWRARPVALLSALTTANLVALAATQTARLGGVRVRHLVSERNQLTRFTARMSRLKRGLVRAGVRLLYPRADAISGNAQGVVDDLAARLGLAPGQVSMLPNPAPEAAQITTARAAPAPHKWLTEPGPVAVAMGRLVAQKDYPTLLAALAQSPPSLRLIVLGEGPLHSALVARATELGLAGRVDFAGFQMNRFDYLAHADLFVLSSQIEGFPNALIEAVAFGLPCVSTDCAGGGPRQILGEVMEQALVPVGDAAAMARAITALLAAPPAPEVISAIAARYRIDAIAAQFLDEVMG